MIKKSLYYSLALIIVLVFSWGCTSTEPQINEEQKIVKEQNVYYVTYKKVENAYYEMPPEMTDIEARNKEVNEFAPYLRGKKIFIDPGHGGDDRKNKSYTGKIIEADVNLRVSLYLRDFLVQAGATVYMSRISDQTVDLKYRSTMANKNKIDLFISVHHNAVPNITRSWMNYTSTYYHAKPENWEYEPCEKDVAKFIQRDLAFFMGNSGGLGSFDGTYSDYEIYPGEGFSVLRETIAPAVLVECAFHTNSMEEARLGVEEFNQLQAWGIFRGLGRYYRAGIPTIEYSNQTTPKKGIVEFQFRLSDMNGILPKTIEVFFDSTLVPHTFLPELDQLKFSVAAPLGEHEIRIIVANKNGNYALPYYKKVIIN
ncbi:MAG: N-acetylmuramoyl-L-alanine amidase [Ignavibacteriales bacterium]|nr:N-acetylmuramoyl-L-alanine amidase [Ignavibacteriales bacterium]